MTPILPPRRRQRNRFQGVYGWESIDHGAGMMIHDVSGRLIGENQDDLTERMIVCWKYYWSPYAYTLMTTDGLVFADVQMDSFIVQPLLTIDRATGQASRRYKMQLSHLR